MLRSGHGWLYIMMAAGVSAQVTPIDLPEVAVYSPRVANQSPVGTFAMPVSALRFEPGVDIQSRNLAEGQSDITIRGGIFENAGFRIGASSLYDPQTGHYLADIPIAPAMLGSPMVLTGAGNAFAATNANVGTVAYGWRPIRTGGMASLGAGEFSLNRQEFYQGYRSEQKIAGQTLAADVDWARSESDGAVQWGDSHFDRVNARVQLAGATAQTDLFAGYQAKRFGWPNLYTPYNSNETENLQTVLLMANHRVDFGAGDYLQAGVYYRRNKDDYAYNRFAPLGPVHPFQHTTWVSGAAVEGRNDVGWLSLNYRGEALADDLHSTSLTAGRYHSRTMEKFSLVPEKSWKGSEGETWQAKAGASFDDSNRADSALSPVIELSREQIRPSGGKWRIYSSYAQTTQLPTYTALNSAAGAGLFRGNPNLGRETTRNLELGAETTLDGWTLRGAVFYRKDDDLVDWTYTQSAATARAANAVDIDTAGLEWVARKAWNDFELVLGYTYLAKAADYKSTHIDASFYALNFAKHRLTAAVVWRIGHGFELRMDNQARIQEVNRLRVIGGNDAVLSSVSLAYRPPAWKRIEFSVAVDNLWDSNFQEVPAVPAAGRQLSAGVVYTW